MTPAGWKHGAVGGRLHELMAVHNVSSKCGRIFLAETGFLLAVIQIKAVVPDIAFVRKDHLPATLPEDAFWPGPPDLAVEVVSPGDAVGEIGEKVQAWPDAGASWCGSSIQSGGP